MKIKTTIIFTLILAFSLNSVHAQKKSGGKDKKEAKQTEMRESSESQADRENARDIGNQGMSDEKKHTDQALENASQTDELHTDHMDNSKGKAASEAAHKKAEEARARAREIRKQAREKINGQKQGIKMREQRIEEARERVSKQLESGKITEDQANMKRNTIEEAEKHLKTLKDLVEKNQRQLKTLDEKLKEK